MIRRSLVLLIGAQCGASRMSVQSLTQRTDAPGFFTHLAVGGFADEKPAGEGASRHWVSQLAAQISQIPKGDQFLPRTVGQWMSMVAILLFVAGLCSCCILYSAVAPSNDAGQVRSCNVTSLFAKRRPSFLGGDAGVRREPSDAELLQELDALAAPLRGCILKRPPGRDGAAALFVDWQDWYMAVSPSCPEHGEQESASKKAERLDLWKDAQLKWWESQAAFEAQEQEIGSLKVNSIAAVSQTSDSDGARVIVIVKHAGDSRERAWPPAAGRAERDTAPETETATATATAGPPAAGLPDDSLVLCFPELHDAAKFCESLAELRGKLKQKFGRAGRKSNALSKAEATAA